MASGASAVSTLRVSLHPAQAAVFNSTARFIVCVAGRRFGKSHLAAYLLGMHAMMNEKVLSDGTTVALTAEHGVYYVAPTQDQAKRILWPKLRNLLGYAKQGGLIANENTNDGWIELINSRRIYIKGADNPDSLRGIGLSFVVLDEYADMKSFVWDEILSDALSDVEGKALFIGTPRGKNHFYRLFMGALEKPKDSMTGTNSAWADWEAFHFKSTDNPFITEREKARMLGGNRSLETIRQEVNADFLSGGGKVLKAEWFELLDRPPASEGSIYITVDLAGFKKAEGTKVIRTDESVVCVTKVIDDIWYVLEIKHGHWDVRKSAFEILTALRKYPGARLGVEQGALKEAVLPYLSEYMREFSRYTTPEELRHNNTKKQDRIAWALQGRAERGRIKLIRAEWNDYFVTQAADFPDPLAHDDALDALAYVDQMSVVGYGDMSDFEEWSPLDQELNTY
jgi:hypothetical protein